MRRGRGRVWVLQGEADTWARLVGAEGATRRVQGTVEEHRLDADVVVEVLQVAEVRGRGRDVGVQVRGAVTGDLQSLRGDAHTFAITRVVDV